MKRILDYILPILFLFVTISMNGQNNVTKNRIPLYVTPVYQFDPLDINVGDCSKMLTSLDINNYKETVGYFSTNIDLIPIEAIFVLSVRLYDIGKKDEAIYWFYTAQAKGKIFIKMLDPEKIGGIGSRAFELRQMFISFNRLAGEYINGYAGGNLEVYLGVCERLLKEIVDFKPVFSIYPNVSFLPDSNRPSILEKQIVGIQKLMAYIEGNKDEIIRKRKEAGIEGLY